MKKYSSGKLTRAQERLLCDEAERRGISVAELLTKVISAGNEVGKIEGATQKIRELILDVNSLKSIIDCASENDLAVAGKKVGENNTRFYLALMNKPCTFDSCFNLLLKLIDEHLNWYSYNVEKSNDAAIINLVDTSKLGRKWLVFLKNYAEAMIKTLLNVEAQTAFENKRIVITVPIKNQNK